MYNITDGKTATKGNELGIFESIGDVYAQEDLDSFFASLARYVSDPEPSLNSLARGILTNLPAVIFQLALTQL